MKLSPNVTDIAEMAKAVEAGGADAISLINTLTGMKIDINRRKFVLANKTGGVSGPAIHPIAVRMVYQAFHAVKVPIIGMGGIASAEDAIEMILAGASAVSVGTANFHNPSVTMEIVDGIQDYMKQYGFTSVNENQYKGLGITSMVLGIVSILLCWTVVMSGLCAVVGAGLGVYYLSKRKQERGFAIAGIATSAFGLILSVFAVAIILIAGTVESQVPSIEEQTPYYEEQPRDDFFDDYYDDFFYDDDDMNQYRDFF